MKKTRLIIVLLAIFTLLLSCGANPLDDHCNTTTKEADKQSEPIIITCEESAFSSYVIPVKVNLDDVQDLKAKENEIKNDGNVYYAFYSVDGLTMTLSSLYSFSSFIRFEGRDDAVYRFRTDKELKMIIGEFESVTVSKLYVSHPEVFGAFENLILPLTFEQTDDNVSLISTMYVGFEYEEQTYSILRDGTVYCGNKKATTKLSDEQAVLFLAYRATYYYGCNDNKLSLSRLGHNAVAVKQGETTNTLTDSNEMLNFLKQYFKEDGIDYSMKYHCDVNVSNKDYGEDASYFMPYRNTLSENTIWYIVHNNGTVTRKASPGLFRSGISGYEELIAPIVQVFSVQ